MSSSVVAAREADAPCVCPRPRCVSGRYDAAWAARVRAAHEVHVSGGDHFQRGYLARRGEVATGPNAPVAASATRSYGGMKPLNEILPRPALDASQAHWTLNRPAAEGEYTPMGSANRGCLI